MVITLYHHVYNFNHVHESENRLIMFPDKSIENGSFFFFKTNKVNIVIPESFK